jgi:hypothetical protein
MRASLDQIQEAVEKTAAFFPAGAGAMLKNTFKQGATWKDIGKKSLIGAGVGAAGNVILGDKNQSIMERATKGAIGGGVAGGLYGAGRQAVRTLQSGAVNQAAAAGRKGFVRNADIHGTFGNQTPAQRERLRADIKAHMAANAKAANPSA